MPHPTNLSFLIHPPKRSLPAIIYALAAALLPYTADIGKDHTRPWIHRDRSITRINRILHQLLALVARMHPKKLGPACFTKLRPRPESAEKAPQATPTPQTPTTPETRPKTPRNLLPRNRPFSARQIATRLATLLRDLEIAAQEIGYPLTKLIRTLCARARTKAGCHALPPKSHKPGGFFASIMTLPPWHPLRL